MKYCMGIDGGGTKTEYVLINNKGEVLARHRTAGISYRQSSIEVILGRVLDGVNACLQPANIKLQAVSTICIGYPCYGESPVNDRKISDALRNALSPVQLLILNDVEIGFAGAMGGNSGIHVVAGTGSITFGKSGEQTARCGGWLDYFSDEGSCYWLGRKTMQLFSQQADGRMPKDRLYDVIRREFKLVDDFEFIDCMLRDYIPYREKVASLQLYLLEAAREGDAAAVKLYHQAIKELVWLVSALKTRLNFDDGFITTYSGSLFNEKELVLGPFIEAVAEIGGTVKPPVMGPAEGAARLALQRLIQEGV